MQKLLWIIHLIAITLWVKGVLLVLTLEKNLFIAVFVFAPVIEELLFRYLPLRFGQKWKCETEMMWVSSIVFALVHRGNYEYLGGYLCFLVQGVLALVLWRIIRKFNYFSAVLFHSCYNLVIFFIF